MGNSKIVYYGETLIDLTGDTVEAAKLLKGVTAHDKKGEKVTGTLADVTQATPAITVDAAGKITASATQAAGVVAAGTKSATKQLPVQAAKTVTPSASAQTAVAKGVFTTGIVTVAAVYAVISVTYPSGSTVTCTNGSKTLTAKDTTGKALFVIPAAGTWTVKAVKGSQSASKAVSITAEGQVKTVELTFVKIYGISRDITATSPAWARTDSAVGKTATATVGTAAGSSDFDNCYPWSGIVRKTLSTGDVMVKIPKFWYRRYRSKNVEYLKIADEATSGFTLHPAFNHGGVVKDYLYVGAYKITSGNKSASGVSPLVNQTRAAMRSNAKAKGTGWGIIDIAALSAIQMLILVEFANNNVQSVIGRGYCDGNSSALRTGTCNNVSGLTGRPAGTDGKVDVVWRGVEGLWGNIFEWVDGINWNNGTYYVCNDPSRYADNTTTNYTALSFKGATNWSSSYITQEGLDTGSNPHVMLPVAAGSGSETTYDCDVCWSSTAWSVVQHGGAWDNGSMCGLFSASLSDASSHAFSWVGSRLLYIPS